MVLVTQNISQHCKTFSVFNQAHGNPYLDACSCVVGRIGRELRAVGFEDVRVHPIVVDTTNTSRATFARMLRFWRDGYVDFLAEHLGETPAAMKARFDDQIAAVEDPERYAGWWLLAVSGRKPA